MMIYIDMNGRCGNQMFQYAFARKLMMVNNQNEITIDFYHVERWKKNTGGDQSFSNQLRFFNTAYFHSIINSGNSILSFGDKKQKKLFSRYQIIRTLDAKFRGLHLLDKFQNRMRKNGIYKEDESSICFVKTKKQNIFLRGYFENPLHFNDIRELLLDEFTPIYPIKQKNKQLYSIIGAEESVCVSIRVWKDLSESEYKKRDVCPKEYYLKAIEKMHELHPNSHFIVFSNDIDWVKKNIIFKYPVSFEDGNDEIWEKLRMMYSCKHFIMSTSTFCWWAQYLSRNKDKTVISPSRWYADGSKSHLLMDDWIKIDV